jgi:hypothetical protein
MDNNDNSCEEIIPFFSVASKDFEQDLIILKKILHQFEQQTYSDENAYKLGQRAKKWQQAGGFMISSSSLILCKRFFNWHCHHLIFPLVIKKLLQ